MNTQQLKPIVMVATDNRRGVAPLTPRAKTQSVSEYLVSILHSLMQTAQSKGYWLEYRGENKGSEGKETCMPAVTRMSVGTKHMKIEIKDQKQLDCIKKALFEKAQLLRNEGDRYEDKKHEDEESGGNRNTSLAKAFRANADDYLSLHDSIPAVFEP